MNLLQVDRAVIPVWRWQGAVITLAATIGSTVATGALPRLVGLGLPAAVAALGLLMSWFYPGAYYRNLSYGIDETGLVIRRGILWRSQCALPRSRIQHSDVAQGPLQRRFGVGTLKLYTAGSRYTKIELPGLAHADALALREALLPREGSGV